MQKQVNLLNQCGDYMEENSTNDINPGVIKNIDTLQNVLIDLRSECISELEDVLLNIHVSFCHDTKKEILESEKARTFCSIYLNALRDVGKEFDINIPLEIP